MEVVNQAIAFGADEICLKDMAGVGRPAKLGRLVKHIKEKHPDTIVQYHGHSGPGLSVASMMEVAKAGADYVDVAIEPLSWGMVHPDLITIHAMLKDAGFKVKDINMKAYMKARALNQKYIDDFLGYFINPRNRFMSSLLVHSGLPGGMMGSMMADLKGVQQGLNQTLEAQGKPALTEDDLLMMLFDEVQNIWPKLGYPPLVTPFSQYVKNIALLNVMQDIQGKEKFSMIDNNAWDMILGKAGKLPGPLAPEIVELAEKQGKTFHTETPQENYPDVLDSYREEMIKNGWETGEDDEELLEFAMHERQYRDYKSGVAKERFQQELKKMKEAAQQSDSKPKEEPGEKDIVSPYMGRIYYNLSYFIEEHIIQVGDPVKKGQRICYIESLYTLDEIVAEIDGTVDEILFDHGDMVSKGDILVKIK